MLGTPLTRIGVAAAVAAVLAAGPAHAAEPASPQPEADQGRACLGKRDGVRPLSIRGIRVGARARVTGPDGRPLQASSVSYCARGGGDVSFTLDPDAYVVLVASTSSNDVVGNAGAVGPGSPAWAARTVFPRMRRHYRGGGVSVYRTTPHSHVVLGMSAGEVRFVAVADRLLLDSRGKLGYHLQQLGLTDVPPAAEPARL